MWEEEYRRMMFPEDLMNLLVEEAIALKYKNIPISLYKYRAIHDHSLDNLLNDTVRFTKASDFNDPYDSGLTINQELMMDGKIKTELISNFSKKYSVEVGSVLEVMKNLNARDTLSLFLYHYSEYRDTPAEVPKIVDEYFTDLLDIHQGYLVEMISLYQESILISCFSEVNDSILMWSHYALDHKGICIEYDFKQCGENHFLTRNLHPVYYSSKLFDMTKFRTDKKDVDVSSFAAITKAIDWEYEQEWRLIFTGSRETAPFNGGVLTPKTIFLGTRISEDDKAKVLEIAQEKNISVKQMRLSQKEYKLYPETI